MHPSLMEQRLLHRYGDFEEWHWWFRGRRSILETVLQRELAGASGLAIASLGCGPPEGLSWLCPIAGPRGRVVGVDADAFHARSPEGAVSLVVGDVARAPLASCAFDVVLLLDVLEHLDDDVAGLREATRLLKPRGLLLVTVPALPVLWGQQDEVSHHRRRYTRRSLERALQGAGLQDPCLSYFNSLLLGPIVAVRLVRRLLRPGRASRSDFEDNHPGAVNDVLAALFGMERHLLGRVPLPLGVSLLATMRR